MADDSIVKITKQGRTSTIHYSEGPGRTVDFGAELGGSGDTLLIVFAPPPEFWDEQLPWAAGRRDSVLERVAREIIRQEAPGCGFRIDRAGVDILAALW
jgi:hypothetical protein